MSAVSNNEEEKAMNLESSNYSSSSNSSRVNQSSKQDVDSKGKSSLKMPEITLLDLNSKSLQAVYYEEQDDLSLELMNDKRINDEGKALRYTLTM
jgi:hypothetical protein